MIPDSMVECFQKQGVLRLLRRVSVLRQYMHKISREGSYAWGKRSAAL